MASSLEDAFDTLLDAASASARFVRRHSFYNEAENRSAGHRFVLSMLMARLEEEVMYHADFPYFRVLDTRIREGGDNPDQRYLFSNVNGGDTYRIWGRLGSATRVDLQIYEGTPYVPGSGGRAASFLTFEELAFGADGTFEIVASSTRQPGNWIENPAEATRVIARQVYGDWSTSDPGELHIDRVGHEGDLEPVLTEEELAHRLRRAAASLDTHVQVWPHMVENNYLAHGPANQISAPFDPGSVGGVPGRYMCHGVFDLADDEALIVRTWPARGNYQGIQLADLWFSSLEYANRQTSLTAEQSQLSADGSYWYVVCADDPGRPNWLDTAQRRRGVILLRYDGMTEPFDPRHHPRAQLVKRLDLSDHLPSDTPVVGPDERRAALAARRRHIQVRYGI